MGWSRAACSGGIKWESIKILIQLLVFRHLLMHLFYLKISKAQRNCSLIFHLATWTAIKWKPEKVC